MTVSLDGDAHSQKEDYMSADDVFTAITKYKKAENQFTAALVYLLDYLWRESKQEMQRRPLCSLLDKLCGASFSPDSVIHFTMQKTEQDEDEDKKVPDFQIESDGALVWVEVKDEAPLGENQLKKYAGDLMKRGHHKTTRLVLLRHHYVSKAQTRGVVHKDITWDTFYQWLKEVQNDSALDETSVHIYLLSEFLKYVAEKGVIVVDTINGESFKTGLPHLTSLCRLVEVEATEVFKEDDLNLNMSATEIGYSEGDFIQYSFDEGSNRGKGYFVGVWGADERYPVSVFLGADAKSDSLQRVKRTRIMVGSVPRDDDAFFLDGGVVYVRRPLESVFAVCTPQYQRQEIGRLLREMYDQLKSIEEPIR